MEDSGNGKLGRSLNSLQFAVFFLTRQPDIMFTRYVFQYTDIDYRCVQENLPFILKMISIRNGKVYVSGRGKSFKKSDKPTFFYSGKKRGQQYILYNSIE